MLDDDRTEYKKMAAQIFAPTRVIADDASIRDHVDRFRRGETSQPMNTWDVSRVTNMEGLFSGDTVFNEDISDWDTSNVTNMRGMFASCESFNGDLSKWDVSQVEDMTSMFEDCKNFCGLMEDWDVRKVLHTDSMFRNCSRFNSDLTKWKLFKVISAQRMFENCVQFDQRLTLYFVNVVSVDYMFANCYSLDQELVFFLSKMKTATYMFANCRKLNQNLRIDCRAALDISFACDGCISLTHDIFVNATKAKCRGAYRNTKVPWLPPLPNHIGVLVTTHGFISDRSCNVTRSATDENVCLFTLNTDVTLAKITAAECGYVSASWLSHLAENETLKDDERIPKRELANPVLSHYYDVLKDPRFVSNHLLTKEPMEELIASHENFKNYYMANSKKIAMVEGRLLSDENANVEDHILFECTVFEKGDQIIQKTFFADADSREMWHRTIDISYWDESSGEMCHFDFGRRIRASKNYLYEGKEFLIIALNKLIDLIKEHASHVTTILMFDYSCSTYEKPEYKHIVESRKRSTLTSKIRQSIIHGYGGRHNSKKIRMQRFLRVTRKKKNKNCRCLFRAQKSKMRKDKKKKKKAVFR